VHVSEENTEVGEGNKVIAGRKVLTLAPFFLMRITYEDELRINIIIAALF